MTIVGPSLRYTVDDLDWARDAFGTPHIEIDEDGALVVSPASTPHAFAVNALRRLLGAAGRDSESEWPWQPPGASGRVNGPDLVVFAAGTVQAGHDELHFDPPPLLVVEMASPTTRRVDRGVKLSEYRLGGARYYLLVDLPALVDMPQPTLELLTNLGDSWESTGPQATLTLPEDLGRAEIRAADLVFQGRIA
jgi:Uma2 family endonuclease